ITCNLSSAPFKKEDATLDPKAGPCTTCPKRSGANQLFADIDKKDRCFDRNCFANKWNIFTIARIKETLENKPDILLLMGYHGATDEVHALAKEHGAKVLKDHTDFSTWKYGNETGVKGIWVSGDDAGKITTVYIRKEKAVGKKVGKVDEVKEAIEGIKQRTKRAAELDQEKVYAGVIGLLNTDKDFLVKKSSKQTPCEMGLIAKMLFNHADWRVRDELRKLFKIKGEGIEVFKKMKGQDLGLMARIIAVNQYSSPFNHNSDEGILVAELARQFKIPVDDIIQNQLEIRAKREARAKQRIAALKPKPIKKAKAKKARKKAAPKKKKK
ncbi:MAG: hypothetical protein WBO32_15685, partial [Cyclobacteriaceae bacterium]